MLYNCCIRLVVSYFYGDLLILWFYSLTCPTFILLIDIDHVFYCNHVSMIFGSICFVCDTDPHITKLDPKSLKCVFLGYSWLQKGYKCFSPTLNRYSLSRCYISWKYLFPVFVSSQRDSDCLLVCTISTHDPHSSEVSSPFVPTQLQEFARPPIVQVYYSWHILS